MKFKKGDKIHIPISKSTGCSWANSLLINYALLNKLKFLYIHYHSEYDNKYVVHESTPPELDLDIHGECFKEQDLVLYDENNDSYERQKVHVGKTLTLVEEVATKLSRQEAFGEMKRLEKYIEELDQRAIEEDINLIWENCFVGTGYVISEKSNIYFYPGKMKIADPGLNEEKGSFRTEKEAKSALAMAQLGHIIFKANEGELLCDDDTKIFIIRNIAGIVMDTWEYRLRYFLSFRTPEIRTKVYSQNQQLIHDYLMID